MKSAALPTPGIAAGAYPERREAKARRGLRSFALWPLYSTPDVERKRNVRFLKRVHRFDDELPKLSTLQFQERLRQARAELAASGMAEPETAHAFALVREATRRQLGLAHFDTQLIAGRIMLDNKLAEMATGEGKTLTAALTAATAALAGMPVHVLTANDYLVTRDAEQLGPVYRALGLTVGAVTREMTQAQRRSAYACDITYCTAKEVVFDYLRDRIVRRSMSSDLQERVRQIEGETNEKQPPLLLRGLWMALIDEADAILIDEALTPFVLSQSRVNAHQQQWLGEALKIASQLTERKEYRIDRSSQTVEITDVGRAALARAADAAGGLWRDRRVREEIISHALSALHVYLRDRHYVISEGEIVMVDQTTGRLAPGRVWSKGLHQLLEVKEGCKPTGELETIAQITYQRFFPRYLRLGGMSGTLRESAGELSEAYGLSVARVPLRRPSRRAYLPIRVYASAERKWQEVIASAKQLSTKQRPVLIGTDSVADTAHVSRRLQRTSIVHTVLNAMNDKEEAQIVSRAGQPGHVTVTTNMAGRGTDIALGPGVDQRGGLHVICCQHNASTRIDRQLEGRCARQGDAGSTQTILSLEDPFIVRFWPAPLRAVLRRFEVLPSWLGKIIVRVPQHVEERRQRKQRRMLLEQDNRSEQRLSFAGRGE